MTVNSEEYDDPYKIKIKKTNPESHARRHSRQFLEKGLGALLANEHFLLLYVPANGAKMKIIRPVSDPHHLRRMMKKANEATRIPSFYFALSHLWGVSENNRHLWYDISKYVDDENGQPAAPVSMRPEKRDTLLRLLRHYPDSYWWIDVLCARSDTPLDIMGDIYSCSIRCIAMVDCPPTLIPQLNTMKDARKDFPHLKSQRGTQSQQYYHSYKELYDEKYPQLIDLLYTLTQSEWWKRVWTWQEMALPFGGVRLLSETATHVSRSNTIVVDKLVYNFEGAVTIWHDIHSEYGGNAASERISTCFEEINRATSFNRLRTMETNVRIDYFFGLLASLSESPRRCMDPVDYVYGVLGIFQIKIPRMSDPDTVWQLFLSELENYMKDLQHNPKGIPVINDHAFQINLRKAKNMADIYKDLVVWRRL